MNLQVGIGTSDDLDEVADAVEEAVGEARGMLKGVEPVAAMVFASVDFDQAALMAALHDVLGDLPMVGCTTDGEITSKGMTQDSLSIMLLAGDGLSAATALAKEITKHRSAGPARAAAEELLQKMGGPGKLVFTFPDNSFAGQGREYVQGMKEALGRRFPIFGGCPAEKARMKGLTYQYYNFEVHSDSGPMLMLDGDFRISSGLRSGAMPLGKVAVCTRSQDNIVFEIDGKPAIEHHLSYLGNDPRASATIAQFPYILPSAEAEDVEYFITLPPFVWLRDTGAIVCAAAIPEGAALKIGQCTRENILKGAAMAAEELKGGLGDAQPRALFVFSCSGRKQILGLDVQKEVETVRAVIGQDVPTFGFYAYGEIGPLSMRRERLAESGWHGYTLSMLALA